jgi:hypothetical protein
MSKWRPEESPDEKPSSMSTTLVTTRPWWRKPAWAICGGSVFGREAKAKPTGTYLRRLPEQIAHAG